MLIFLRVTNTQSLSMNIDYRYCYIHASGKRMHYQIKGFADDRIIRSSPKAVPNLGNW